MKIDIKKIAALFLLKVCFVSVSLAQVEEIKNTIQLNEIEAHLRFLASDELRGRDTGSPELDIAALYIAEVFRSYGLQPVQGAEGFYQPVQLIAEKPPAAATFAYQDNVFTLGEDLLIISGDSTEIQAPVLYANYALPEDLAKLDIKGKIVVAKAGTPEQSNPQSFFFSSHDKQVNVAEKGGLALVELYQSEQIPWSILVQYLNAEQLTLYEEKKEQEIPLLWLNDPQEERLSTFQDKKKGEGMINIAGKESTPIPAKNVAAFIEGTDPNLKDQYIILSAHYDHVGVGKSDGVQDSIYNGARDNGIGITALLTAADYFSKNPPQRSLLFLAVTAEEKGMLGSSWYANHPLLPLDQMVFNMNTDGAGYNDTTKVTVIGLERTTAEKEIQAATEPFGLTAITDPAPEQNLYDRSDNVSFAAKGIPAVDFAPGLTAFDQEIMKHYHQVTDEIETINLNYVEKFVEAFTLATEKIANMPEHPFWKQGDKYESAGKDLYGK